MKKTQVLDKYPSLNLEAISKAQLNAALLPPCTSALQLMSTGANVSSEGANFTIDKLLKAVADVRDFDPNALDISDWPADWPTDETTGFKPLCLGTSKYGSPKHPLYIKADISLIEWKL